MRARIAAALIERERMQSAGGPRYFAAHYRLEALERQLDRLREHRVRSNTAASLFVRKAPAGAV